MMVRSTLIALGALVLAMTISHGAAAADPPLAPLPSVAERFTLRYLCVCPSFCPKPLPASCWRFEARCDDYCGKPLPCRATPCPSFRGDDYDNKSLPCRYPQPLCPVPFRCW